MERYCLAQDKDCHWYVIPVLQIPNWTRWCDYPEDDERSLNPPDFAKSVGGSPSLVSFTDPQIH
jgi:hypothetical protein